MKFLSFCYNEQELYGVKVKKEEKAWNIIKLLNDFDNEKMIPTTLKQAIEVYGLDFIEKIRKVIRKAEISDNINDYKVSFNDIIWRSPIINSTNNIMIVNNNYDSLINYMNLEPSEINNIKISNCASSSVSSNNMTIPSHSTLSNKLDYEASLAVVISKTAKNILKPLAIDYIFGYTIMNNIVARDVKNDFLKNSLEKTSILGPYLVTKDEMPILNDITIVTKVNGEIRQNSVLKEMIVPVDDILVEISKYTTLKAGDIISTGTPIGTGESTEPSVYLKTGDEIKITIDAIGTLNSNIGE